MVIVTPANPGDNSTPTLTPCNWRITPFAFTRTSRPVGPPPQAQSETTTFNRAALVHCSMHMLSKCQPPIFRMNHIDSSIDHVISAVDVNGIASNKPGRVVSQERRCGADVFDADQATRRRFDLRLFK
jgi:hypothetical protein